MKNKDQTQDTEQAKDTDSFGLSAELAALVSLSAALAVDEPADLQSTLVQASRVASLRKVEEVLLQAYLFLGFPTVLNAFAVWREISGRTAAAAPKSVLQPGDLEGWTRRGEHLGRRIYGRAYQKLRRNIRRLHPDLDEWMVMEGYGKVLSRPGLDTGHRELCIVSLLAAADKLPQLHSHLRGALNVGVPPEAVESALALGLSRLSDRGHRDEAETLWVRVHAVWERTPEKQSRG